MCDLKSNKGEMQEPQYSLIVRVVSSVLDKLISGHVDSPKRSVGYNGEFVKFQSSYAPDVTIESYLERIRRYSRCSDACFVMSLIYVDRLIESKNLVLTTLNAHRLLITSVMLAAKFHDDLFYNNSYYSKLGGLSLNELNHLEAELLHLLDFSLFVKEVAYCKYSMQLQNYVFYLEVVPSPRTMSAGGVPQHAYFEAQPAVKTMYTPQSQLAAPHPALMQQSLRNAAHCVSSQSSVGGISAPPHIPSPDNPHAKACLYSEQYINANSPLHIAPASAPHVHQLALYQAQAAQQLHAQQQAQLLAQRYAQNYHPPRARSPLDCQLGLETGCGADGVSVDPVLSLSSYFNNYAARDFGDESTTTCSTRTASPYPALYSRSSSSNMLLAGGVVVGGGVSGTGGLHACNAVVPMQRTPSMYPASAPVPATSTWSQEYASRSPQPAYHPDLSIQIDLSLDYPMQRGDSGVSITTPHSVYNGAQYQRSPLQRSNYHQHLMRYQDTSSAPSPLGAYTDGAHAAVEQQNTAMAHGSSFYPVSQVHTPTDRRYAPPSFSFQPAPEIYGYGPAAQASCSSRSEDCVEMQMQVGGSSQGASSSSSSSSSSYYPAHAGCHPSCHMYSQAPGQYNNNIASLHQNQQQSMDRVSPYHATAMLYGMNAAMNNIGANHSMVQAADPINFYGFSAGVGAGQM